eukprot:scaffold125680_cov36-Tisochrysis_lutea.AAC.2
MAVVPVLCGSPALAAASLIASNLLPSWSQPVTVRAILRGRAEYSPKPESMTNGTLPASCPGKKDDSMVGSPRIAASAMVPVGHARDEATHTHVDTCPRLLHELCLQLRILATYYHNLRLVWHAPGCLSRHRRNYCLKRADTVTSSHYEHRLALSVQIELSSESLPFVPARPERGADGKAMLTQLRRHQATPLANPAHRVRRDKARVHTLVKPSGMSRSEIRHNSGERHLALAASQLLEHVDRHVLS